MEALTISGVVLRETKYRESDAIITLLTSQKGILTASVKGLYKSNSKNRAAIQLFCFSEFELTTGKGGYVVKTAIPRELFYNIRIEPEHFALCCYISETLCSFCTSEADETEAFRLCLNTFSAIDAENRKPLWLIKAAFEFKLCCVCGFTPMLDGCGICDAFLDNENCNDLFFQKGRYTFSLTDGALICNPCLMDILSKNRQLPCVGLTVASLYAARYISTCPIERFLSFRINEENAVNFADFTEKYLLFTAERGFSSLKYYKTLISELGQNIGEH